MYSLSFPDKSQGSFYNNFFLAARCLVESLCNVVDAKRAMIGRCPRSIRIQTHGWLRGKLVQQELFKRGKNGNDVMMAQFIFLFLTRAIFRETSKEIEYRRKFSKGMHLLLLALRIMK